MTTPEGVTSDELVAIDELAPRERARIIRIRTTAMGAVPKRTYFAILAKPSLCDEGA